MCDYSLETIKTRPAKVGDKLFTRRFSSATGGFCAPEDIHVAVCLLPGTELSFAYLASGRCRAGWSWSPRDRGPRCYVGLRRADGRKHSRPMAARCAGSTSRHRDRIRFWSLMVPQPTQARPSIAPHSSWESRWCVFRTDGLPSASCRSGES
jgi:hypothetical protein